MLKLVLKRLALTITIVFLCYTLIILSSFLLALLNDTLQASKTLRSIITYAICFIGSAAFIFDLKLHNKQVLQAYSEHWLEGKYNLRNNCLFVIKSKEFLANLIVLNLISVPLEIYMGISSKTPPLQLIFSILLYFALQNLVLIILDILLWLIVFSKWNKKLDKVSDD